MKKRTFALLTIYVMCSLSACQTAEPYKPITQQTTEATPESFIQSKLAQKSADDEIIKKCMDTLPDKLTGIYTVDVTTTTTKSIDEEEAAYITESDNNIEITQNANRNDAVKYIHSEIFANTQLGDKITRVSGNSITEIFDTQDISQYDVYIEGDDVYTKLDGETWYLTHDTPSSNDVLTTEDICAYPSVLIDKDSITDTTLFENKDSYVITGTYSNPSIDPLANNGVQDYHESTFTITLCFDKGSNVLQSVILEADANITGAVIMDSDGTEYQMTEYNIQLTPVDVETPILDISTIKQSAITNINDYERTVSYAQISDSE